MFFLYSIYTVCSYTLFFLSALFYLPVIFTFSHFGIFRQQALFHVLSAYSMYNVVSLLFYQVSIVCVIHIRELHVKMNFGQNNFKLVFCLHFPLYMYLSFLWLGSLLAFTYTCNLYSWMDCLLPIVHFLLICKSW